MPRAARLLPAIALATLGGGAACRRASAPEPPPSLAPSPPPPVTPSLCNTISNDAVAVPFTRRSGPLPTFTGGALEDGLYRATSAEGFGDVDPSGRRMTLVVSGHGTELAWSGDVLDARGVAPLASLRANAQVSASANRLALTPTCTSISPSPIPTAMAFTVKPGALVLGLVDAGGDFVTTYTRVAVKTETPR